MFTLISDIYSHHTVNNLQRVSQTKDDYTTETDAYFGKNVRNVEVETPVYHNISVPNSTFKSKSNKLIVLMYHHIDDMNFSDRYYYVKTSSFFNQMKYLYESGYTLLTFDNIEDYEKYKNPIVITFDDGYEDNYLNAYPILKHFNLKATIFLIAQFIDKPTYLKTDNIKEMRDVISFQSHTNCHPNLKTIDKDSVEKECFESRQIIENFTSEKVVAIAYPYGMYNPEIVDTVKKYYSYGITGDNGYFKLIDDRYKIKRVAVTFADTLNDFIKKVH